MDKIVIEGIVEDPHEYCGCRTVVYENNDLLGDTLEKLDDKRVRITIEVI